MARFIILFTLMHIFSTLNGQNDRQGKDFALFFAVEDYNGNTEFGNLQYPIDEVEDVDWELREMYGFHTEVHRNLTKVQIESILQSWQRKTFPEDGQLLVFFSGHGTFRKYNKSGYFIPKGKGSDYENYIPLIDIERAVTGIPCKHILLVVDACYSGTIDPLLAVEEDYRGKPNAPDEKQQIVKAILKHKSRLFVTSGGKERTPDKSKFTEAFIKGLRRAYTQGNGLYTYYGLLGDLVNVIPSPHKGDFIGDEGGGFVFVSKVSNQNHESIFPSQVTTMGMGRDIPDSTPSFDEPNDKGCITYRCPIGFPTSAAKIRLIGDDGYNRDLEIENNLFEWCITDNLNSINTVQLLDEKGEVFEIQPKYSYAYLDENKCPLLFSPRFTK